MATQQNNLLSSLAALTGKRSGNVFIGRLGTIISVDAYSDSTTLPDGFVQRCDNMVLLKNIAYTREGWVKYNPIQMAGDYVQALGEYLPDLTTSLILSVVGGNLYSGSSGVMTLLYSKLNATNICQIAQTQDVALVIDGESGLLVYKEGDTPYLAGTSTPNVNNLLGSFQANEVWTVVNGTQLPSEGYVTYGEQSITFITDVGAVMTVSHTLSSSADLTKFPDGSVSTVYDLIRLSFLRGDPTTFTSCVITLGDATGLNYFYLDLAGLTKWSTNIIPYYAFDFQIPKLSFSAVGSPNWNDIKKVQFIVTPVGGKQAGMTLDWLTHFKSAPIATVSASAGNLTAGGVYYYKVTFLTANDNESDASLISNACTATSGHKINVSNIPISGSSRVVKRRLYRMGGTSTLWKLVVEFYENYTTTFTDNIPDTSLGNEYVDTSGTPYIADCLAIHGEFVVLANLISPDNLNYPSGISVSNEGSYEIFDPLNIFEIEPQSGMGIKWLHSEFNKCYVGKEDSIWSFDPLKLDVPPTLETRLWSAVGKNGVCSGENCFFYLDQRAVVRCDGTTHTEVSTPFVRNYINQIPLSAIKRVWMRYYDHVLYVGIPIEFLNENVVDGSGNLVLDILNEQVVEKFAVTNNLILCMNTTTGQWYTFTGWNVSCALTSFSQLFGRHLYLGSASSGYIYDALVGDDDDGDDIVSTIITKDDDFGEPETMKDFIKLYLMGRKLTNSDVQLSITPVADTVSSGIVIADNTTLIDSLTHKRLEIPMPQLNGEHTFLGLIITATKRWAMRTLTQIIRPREATY